MAENDRTNSIIDEAFARFNNPNSEQANNLLTDPNSRRALAVSIERGNDLTEEPGVGSDLANMTYGQLLVNYGPEVADNQIRLRNQVKENRATRDVERTAGEVIGDTAKSAAGALVSGISNTSGAVVAGLDSMRQGGTFAEGAVPFAESSSRLNQEIFRDTRSEALRAREGLLGIEAGLDNLDSQAQRDREVAAGENEMLADFRQVGRDALSAIDRAQQDVGVTGDIVASGVGSLIPSAILAASGASILAGGTNLVVKSQIASRVAAATGSAIGAGASEAGGTYSETVNEVLGMTEEQLQNSDVYNQMLTDGMTPEEARVNFAGVIGETAFKRQLPTAIAIGFLSSKFNSAPIGAFAEKGIVGGLRTIIGEGLEETLQGTTSQVNQNLLLGELDGRTVAEGVGQAGVEGAIGGIGQAGVSAAPRAALGVLQEVVKTSQGIAAQVPQITQAIQNAASRPDRAGQLAGIESSLKMSVQADSAIASGKMAPEVAAPDTTPVPEGFEDAVGGSVFENVIAVTYKLAENAKPTQAQLNYAGVQYSRLRGMMNSLPASVKSQAQAVINSPQAKSVLAKMDAYDQNKTTTPVAEITPDVVSETVSIAQTNPANVNPETVDKILKESGENISPEKIPFMKSASKIARRINEHAKTALGITTDVDVALTKQGKPVGKAKTLDGVSRSITVEGYTDKSGKELRSINNFAADIFAGLQSPDGTIISDLKGSEGQVVKVTDLMNQFGNFVQHLQNKINAFNESYAQNDRRGHGPTVRFDSLVGGTKFVPAGSKGNAKGVFYNRSNPKSAETARAAQNDLQVAADIYNQLIQDFPDQFGSLSPVTPATLLEDAGGYIDVEQLALEIDAQEQAEIASVKEQQGERRLRKDALLKPEESLIDQEDGSTPRAVDEEVSATAESSEEQTPTTTEEDIIEAEVVESQYETEVVVDDLDVKPNADGLISDDNGEVVTFYHGTKGDFDTFNDSEEGIFMTTRKGQGREYAIGGGRLMSMNVKADNPLLVEAPEGMDAQDAWLSQTTKIKSDVANGNHDAVIIVDSRGDAIVIVFQGDKIVITNPDVDGTRPSLEDVDTAPEGRKVHESFETAYVDADNVVSAETADEYLSMAEESGINPAVMTFARKLMNPLRNTLNKKLQKTPAFSSGKGLLVDKLKEGVFQKFIQYRATAIADPETGTYDTELMNMAILAVADWMANVTKPTYRKEQKYVESLGLDYDNLTNEEVEIVRNGVPLMFLKDQIGRDVLRFWNKKQNVHAKSTESKGIVESVVAEILDTLVTSQKSNLINRIEINQNGKTHLFFDISGLEGIQEQIAAAKEQGVPTSLTEAIFKVQKPQYVVGDDRTPQSENRRNRSGLETDTVSNMEDTQHFANTKNAQIFGLFDKEILASMLGFRSDVNDDPDIIKNESLLKSIMGKNAGVFRNIQEVTDLLLEIGGDLSRGVRYPVNSSAVGRHMYQGPNPQTNKLIRMMVTPTWSDEISFEDKRTRSFFFLTAAQSTGFKVEKANFENALKNVEKDFMAEYGKAVAMMRDALKNDELDSQAFSNLMGGKIDEASLSAIIAVADMLNQQESGAETFRTSLSFELDGVTNGPANMMILFGQGTITPQEYGNLNSVGLFLGKAKKTLNDFFSVGNKDLYEKSSAMSQKAMYTSKATNMTRTIGAFASYFGTFDGFDNPNDQGFLFELTRNSSKNPMTAIGYSAGVSSISEKLAKDMMIEFYKQIQDIPAGTDLAQHLGYPNIYKDIETLFGIRLPQDLKEGAYEFPSNAVANFNKNVTKHMGKALLASTETLIGAEAISLKNNMIMATNIQSLFQMRIYEAAINRIAEEKAKADLIGRNKAGDPIISELSQADFDRALKEANKFAPIFRSEEQDVDINGNQTNSAGFSVSQALSGRFDQDMSLKTPSPAGVKSAAYTVQGSGDAMMMNFIFGGQNAPKDAINVWDGFDIPVTKIEEYSQLANEAVLKTWDRDVIGMFKANFDTFLRNASKQDAEMLQAAMDDYLDEQDNEALPQDLDSLKAIIDDQYLWNQARKAAFKHFNISVDQMAGGNVGYTREGEGGEATLSEINEYIHNYRMGTLGEKDVKIDIIDTTLDAYLETVTLTAEQKSIVQTLKETLGDTKVVFGTIDQLNAYRQENFPDDGQILEGNAQYDSGNGTIFLTNKSNTESIIHEMVHAATYSAVLSHYEGNRNQAVERLELLMDQFMELTSDNDQVNEAQTAIGKEQALTDAQSKAAAINEFMAYALANSGVKTLLKGTEANLIKTLTQKVIQLIKRVMGGVVPTSMFDHVVFNTKVLKEVPEVDDNGNGDNQGPPSDEVTPEAERYTNFWIETIVDYVDKYKVRAARERKSTKPLVRLNENVKKVVEGYRQVGMLSDNNARTTFKAMYMVLSSGMKLDSNNVIALTKMFQHIEENMTPDMFGSHNEAGQEYSAVINSFGAYKNGDISDAIAVVLALSQTSKKFRDVLAQIPDPEGETQTDNSLNATLEKVAGLAMRKIVGALDTKDKTVLEVLDSLDHAILDLNQEREFSVMRHVTSTLTKADKFVSSKFSQTAELMNRKNKEVEASTRSNFKKSLVATVTLGTNLLSSKLAAETGTSMKRAVHMNVPILSLVPIREGVSEVIGTDAINKKLIAFYDIVTSRIAGMRQAYREDLPGILQDLFKESPNAEQWKSMHTTLGKTDFTRFLGANISTGMRLLEEGARRKKRISELEAALDGNYVPYIAQDAKEAAQKLANFMNGKGAGKLLLRNAYAIAKNLDGDFNEGMVDVIDELTTMYVIDQMESSTREDVVKLWESDPKAIAGIVSYIQGLNEAEDAKEGITEAAKLNAYKGYIPNHGDTQTRVIIDDDSNENALEKRGYTKLGAFTGDVNNVYPRSYYVSTTRQGGEYSQGIMQNVHGTYRGVDLNTGMTVTGETSGFITGDGVVESIMDQLTDATHTLDDPKETLMPVFDDDGDVIGFERAINPDVFRTHMKQDENLALMLGAWAGRHVEEMLATEYNKALVDVLERIYETRESGSDEAFVNIKRTDDPIYKESFKLIPNNIKQYMDGKFDGDGPMIRKDMINLSVGYREFSITDMWTGKTRLPEPVQKTIVAVTQMMMGKSAMKRMSQGEVAVQGVVSSAKDIIVIRSLVVPAANLQANVIQLATRGVPTKQIWKGFRDKLAEVEEYNKNITRKIRLEAELRLNKNNSNKVRVIESKIQAIDDLTARMTIAPLLAAGAYKQLSEGITDLDVDLTKGRLGDFVEGLAEKLPAGVSDIAKVGLVSKSTKLYQVANRATQYGDFLGKSIYYDHLIAEGFAPEEALAKMNEEFVNFSLLPGRSRSALERYGLTWFMAFKIRITKIAMQQIRENPMRALAVNSLLPDIGSPIGDNIVSVAFDGKLDYATGYEMLFAAPELNPWVNLFD